MAAPTVEELDTLKQFRSRVIDLEIEESTDLSLLRWLRAREMNLDVAEAMLRKHMEWRQSENLLEIMDWVPPDLISKNYPYEITGHDDVGHPICILPFGDWDVRKVVKFGGSGPFFRNIDQMFARIYTKMKETSIEFNQEVTQCIILVDFGNFGMAQFISISGVNALIELVRRFESNYPEILYKMYFVNGFRLFQLLFAMLKPFFSPHTLSKIEIYTSPDRWIPVLQNKLPRDQIPKEFGGTKLGSHVSTYANSKTTESASIYRWSRFSNCQCKLALFNNLP